MTWSHSRTVNTGTQKEDTQGNEEKGANREAGSRQKQGACRTEPGKHRRETQRVGKQKWKREALKIRQWRKISIQKKPLTKVWNLLEARVWDHKSLMSFFGTYLVERWSRVKYKVGAITGQGRLLSYFKSFGLERSSRDWARERPKDWILEWCSKIRTRGRNSTVQQSWPTSPRRADCYVRTKKNSACYKLLLFSFCEGSWTSTLNHISGFKENSKFLSSPS